MSTPFTWAGFRLGLLAGGPLAAATLPYGLAFGALTAQQGLSSATAALMSAVVHSGAAQFAALQFWTTPPVLLPILFATFAMNARYLLYGVLLRPHLTGLSPLRTYPALFVMGDANWALMMRHGRDGTLDGAFAFGSGLAMYAGWVGGTWLGTVIGQVDLGGAIGLDYLLSLYVAALLAGLWRGRADVAPLAAAALAAILADRLLGQGWSVVCGGLAGVLLGAIRASHDG